MRVLKDGPRDTSANTLDPGPKRAPVLYVEVKGPHFSKEDDQRITPLYLYKQLLAQCTRLLDESDGPST